MQYYIFQTQQSVVSIDEVNNRVGVNNEQPQASLHVNDTIITSNVTTSNLTSDHITANETTQASTATTNVVDATTVVAYDRLVIGTSP